jgi:polyisoprenoid-binding protein YceI
LKQKLANFFRSAFYVLLICGSLSVSGQSNQSPLIFANTSENIVLVGYVRGFDFSSPETTIEIEVQGSANQQSLWRVVTASATELRRFGWTSQSLFEGELVQVIGAAIPGSRLTLQLNQLVRANGQALLPEIESIFDQLVSGSYQPLPSQGSIQLSFDHYGFSRTSFYFNNFDASLILNAEELNQSSFQLDLLTEELDSSSFELTRLLKSGVFFDASNFPLISIQATAIEQLDTQKLIALADISIKGISYPAQFEVTLNASGVHPESSTQSIGFSGSGQLLRSNWEFSDFIPEISDQIQIEFQMEFGVVPESPFSNSLGSPEYPYNQP